MLSFILLLIHVSAGGGVEGAERKRGKEVCFYFTSLWVVGFGIRTGVSVMSEKTEALGETIPGRLKSEKTEIGYQNKP